MTAPKKMAKRAAAGTLALAICFTGGVIGAGAASAAPGFNFDTRLSGATRIDTAVDASKAAFPTSNTVVVVNSDRFADGLTASYAAGIADNNAGAPVLYVNQAGIPDQTKAEIQRLGAKNVTIVGGTAVVPQKVQDELDSFVDNVNRLSGKDRYETAAKVALSGSKDVGTVFLANGDATADALAAGPIAYRSHNPIVLVQKDSVPSAAKDALDQLNETRRIVVGGTAVVSDSGYTAANATSRLRGVNRQGTAIEVAKYAIANEDGFDSGNIALIGSQDRNAADALVAAPVAGKAGTPILFTSGTTLGADTAAYLQSIAADLDGTGYVFGGRDAVPENVAGEAKAAAGGDAVTPPITTNATLAITPADAAVLTVADEAGDDATSDDRVYTVTGLDNSLKYRVTLVDAENITLNDDNKYEFEGSGTADRGSVASDITLINGVPTGAPATATPTVGSITPSNGNITFRVDADGYEAFVPVVYVDGGADTALEIDNDGLPTEPFGVGGAVAALPAEAEDGADATDVVVTDVFTDGTFVAADDDATLANAAVYKFDDNDIYTVANDGGVQVQATRAAFAQRLTVGDTVTITDYQQDPALKSTFALTNVGPGAVTPTADPGERSIVITVPDAELDEDATLNVYYAVDTALADAADPAYSATTFKKATFTEDDDDTTNDFQATISGLTAGTDYQLYVSQTTNGDESTKTGLEAATDADTAPAYVPLSVTANDVNDGVGSTNQVIVEFDQEVSVLDASKFTLTPTNQPTFVFTGTSATKANTSGTRYVVTLDKTLQDAATDVGYTLTVGANAVQDASSMKNVAATDTFDY